MFDVGNFKSTKSIVFPSVSVRKHGGSKSVFLDSNSPSLVKTTQKYCQIARLSLFSPKRKIARLSLNDTPSSLDVCAKSAKSHSILNDTQRHKTAQNNQKRRHRRRFRNFLRFFEKFGKEKCNKNGKSEFFGGQIFIRK